MSALAFNIRIGQLDQSHPKLEGIFASLFGIELALIATSIKDSSDRELKTNIWQVCWQTMVTANGLVGEMARSNTLFQEIPFTTALRFSKKLLPMNSHTLKSFGAS